MTRDEMVSILVGYLERKKPIHDLDGVQELDYMQAGYVDSLGFMKFLLFVEDRFDVEFDDEEIGSDAFRTLGGLVGLIKNKQDEKQGMLVQDVANP